MKLWRRAGLRASLIGGIAALGGATSALASPLPASAWDAGINKAVSADVVASTSLPDGVQVYVFGDTMRVNGTVICSPSSCPFGFPHDSVALERPGSAAFAMQSCSAFGCPYGWQWVPNWSDGSEFWMAFPVAYGANLYVVGSRVSTSGTGCSFGCIEGEYVARFAIGSGDALNYKGLTQLTGAAGGSDWGSAVADRSAGGWWLTGTRSTVGSGCLTDCKTMDAAFVPFAGASDPAKWKLAADVLPSGHGWDLGTVASLAHVGSRWVIFTKQNDIIGSAIEELESAHVTSGWSRTGTYPISPVSNCALTYSAQVHPGDGAPAGEMLVSWASNGNVTGTVCPYVALFGYLPVN